jgi:hypothetical protein
VKYIRGKGLKLVYILVGLIAITGAICMSKPVENVAILVKEGIETGEEEVLIGVISDTHIPSRAKEIPGKAFLVFQGAEYLIHAGDIVSLEVIEDLEKIAPVVAVKGNMDRGINLPEMNSLEIEGWRIGVVHDSFSPWRMGKMKRIARENAFDVLIFGHTHRPFVREEDGKLFLNPGSPTNPFLSKPSVALLKVRKDRIEAEIINLQ